MKADPDFKKKGHDLKYQKAKKTDGDKSGVRKNRSRRDVRSRDLSQQELRDRRRARSPDRKPNRSRISNIPPTPRHSEPRKFLVDPPKALKRNVTPSTPIPVVETKSKKKFKPPFHETIVADTTVPETSYGKRIWGFVNRQAFHSPLNSPESDTPPSTPPELKSPKHKRHKESNDPKGYDVQSVKSKRHKESRDSDDSVQLELKPQKSKSKHKNVPESINESPPSTSRRSLSDKHGNFAKRFLRKQVWAISKPYIKRNKRLSQLLEESKVNIDKIKINALGLDVINVDALGIKNKALKRGVIWLLK